MGRQAVGVVLLIVTFLLLLPLIAALFRRAADAAVSAVPAMLILWLIVAVLTGMVKKLLH